MAITPLALHCRAAREGVASRRVLSIHLSGCHRTRRARVRALEFLIIFQSIFMQKRSASSTSLSLSLSPSFSFIVFRQSQIHSAEREAKNFPRFTSSRSSPRPPSVSPFALSLARICSMHAFSLRSSRWMKFYTFRSRRRAISFARPDLSFVRSFFLQTFQSLEMQWRSTTSSFLISFFPSFALSFRRRNLLH